MNVHEFQGKQVFLDHGVPVPAGQPAESPEQAVAIYGELGTELAVVKCQIHAGGRGKGNLYSPEGFDPQWLTIDEAGVPHLKEGAPESMKPVLVGGVKLVRSRDEVVAAARGMLGNILVTKQTGPTGKKVNRILVEEGSDIDRELYISCLVDRATSKALLMASAEGGMAIEVIAAERPEALIKEWFQPHLGLHGYQARRVAKRLGMNGKAEFNGMVKLLMGTTKAFGASDAAMLEINPCVVTKQGTVVALDAKLSLDDNALFRHKKIAAMRDLNEEEPAETKARDADLAYIKLDGDIGCLVNGAGLAMSTMDIIKYHGGGKHSPANFLDVGGGADKEKVKTAFSIILEDPHVKAILVNIFGGIMRCDTIAEGVVAASREIGLNVPLVVRLEGNMKPEGKAILEASGLNIIPADGMTDAAKKVVAAVESAA
jgi:succinyl-CoA synthetase beta subunit